MRSLQRKQLLLDYLIDTTGLALQVARVDFPAPGVTRISGFTAQAPSEAEHVPQQNLVSPVASTDQPDAATGPRLLASALPPADAPALSCPTLRLINHGAWWEVMCEGLTVDTRKPGLLHHLLVQQLTRLKSASQQRGWLFKAKKLTLLSHLGSVEVDQLTIGLSPYHAETHAWLELWPAGARQPVLCRLQQGVTTTWSEFHLDTGPHELPLEWAGILEPNWQPSGDPGWFRGAVRGSLQASGWEVQNVPLADAVATTECALRFPRGRKELGLHSGELRVRLDECRVEANQVQALSGHLSAKRGAMDSQRLAKLVTQLGGWVPDGLRLATHGSRQGFETLSGRFVLSKGSFQLTGDCQHANHGVLMVGDMDQPLAVLARSNRRATPLQLAHALAPLGAVSLPVGQEAGWLQCLVPRGAWYR